MTAAETGPAPGDGDEGYTGPAQLVADESTVEVSVTLRGVFQPIDGRYHWYGRLAHDSRVDEAVASGATVTIRTPHGTAQGKLSDRDPWGRFRITGTGTPPFEVDQ
jgi:hypothetical protein